MKYKEIAVCIIKVNVVWYKVISAIYVLLWVNINYILMKSHVHVSVSPPSSLFPYLHLTVADSVCQPRGKAGVQQVSYKDRPSLLVSLHFSVLYRQLQFRSDPHPPSCQYSSGVQKNKNTNIAMWREALNACKCIHFRSKTFLVH